GASLQRGYLWALIFTIVLSLIMTGILRLAENRLSTPEVTSPPSMIHKYLRAIEQTNLFLVPLVVVASWLMPTVLDSRDYFALYLTSTIYFVYTVFVGNRRYQGLHLSAGYVLGLLT